MGSRPLAITCAPCRTRKVKCDSGKPVCGNCAKSPNECYYPVKLKPGLRPGTGTDMARRLENLEERIQSYEIRLADQETRLTHVQQSAAGHAGPSQPFPGLAGNTSLYTGLPQPSPMDALVQPTSGSSSANAAMPPLDFSSFGPSASPSGHSAHSFRDPNILPPDDIVRDLIGLFFTFIHPWAPIISPILPPFSAPWSIVVHAIVVVSLRYSNDPRLPPSTQATYRQAAKQHVLAHAIESTSISSVQALALLALDLIGSEQGPSSWGLLALLTRSAVHLGLAKEEDAAGQPTFGGRAPAPSLSRTSIIPPPADWREDETRRRLFWLIFCLDRYACVSTGWDFAIPDSEVKRRLPCANEIWAGNEWCFTPLFRPVPHRQPSDNTSNISPLAHLVEALDLLGRAHTLQAEVIEPGDSSAILARKEMTIDLTGAARGCFEAVGPSVTGGRQDGLTLMIQAIHHATLLKLNAYYAYPALATGEPIEPHTSTCLTAAGAIVDLIHTARAVGWMTASTPFFIWGCWVAARVLFVHAFLAHRTGPDEAFDEIVGCLREQAGYWGLANQYVRLLERAKRKWQDSMPSSDPPNPSLPDAIHVLLDLRRTAYSAVTTNTQETPHVSPPDVDLSHLPAWAVQPLLGDLHGWFDLPAGLFQGDL
ncbi:fungal-specific transcription factor domain-containing protein [Dioszegia hungarica]|uniref:Fungal-specific transcription factor domain-containing protein n=1 Tax=Dioszegia hungarica TaxID=4972 RepID=A0AA38LT58_9TREE|nr:fungal-specific transcription factor domain-containing protein [Dioszegia hungarica]KAI9636462.1 fungal-specific transcription factor domain-containing protein [Dioszegia hungarica]